MRREAVEAIIEATEEAVGTAEQQLSRAQTQLGHLRAELNSDGSPGERVIPGGAGHWYALWEGETLMGRPMEVGEIGPPRHPGVNDDGWYEITEPAPDVDDAALIAELSR